MAIIQLFNLITDYFSDQFSTSSNHNESFVDVHSMLMKPLFDEVISIRTTETNWKRHYYKRHELNCVVSYALNDGHQQIKTCCSLWCAFLDQQAVVQLKLIKWRNHISS